MPKHRKMLNDMDAPYILSLMRLMETQSKTTLANWAIDYTLEHILPIYEKAFNDPKPKMALNAAQEWLDGKVKLPYVKKCILDCHAVARELDDHPAAQAAVRACGQAAATIHVPTHALGLALYGALAVAYDRIGMGEKWEVYENAAAEECTKMEGALRAVSVEQEPNPAKLNWNC